jgi:hypothetical protein
MMDSQENSTLQTNDEEVNNKKEQVNPELEPEVQAQESSKQPIEVAEEKLSQPAESAPEPEAEEEKPTEEQQEEVEATPVAEEDNQKEAEVESEKVSEDATEETKDETHEAEAETTAEEPTDSSEPVTDTVAEAETNAPEEAKVDEETEAKNETAPEVNPLITKVYSSKDEVITRLKEIASQNENPDKQELDHLKAAFYKLHLDEADAAQKAFIDGGGKPEEFHLASDDSEEAFKAEMSLIKEKRAVFFKQQEEEKDENLKKKLEIIERIKAMATSPDAANKAYQEFKDLQQKWKEIKSIPTEKANELWRNYHLYTEKFYDLLNLNREAREYDFKKNLEAKTKLCEAAEKLTENTDIISAFHQLQELHQQYREIGPVEKDLREQVWNRFKAASTIINKRHQEHFEKLRDGEEENLTKKTELCEKVEAITAEGNKNAADWDKHTKEIIELQAEWKKIGFAPQKMNVKIFERFRAACDKFFSAKAEFFKTMRQQFSANAEKKKALVEKAKALTDSTEWKSTSDKLIALQKEWKTIGTVPRKLGDQLWSEFLGACNHFFEARNAANSGTKNEERANLESKRSIIEQLNALLENAADATQEKVMQLVDEYNNIGHVPFREKDRLYKEFHDALDKIYDELHISVSRRRLDNFKSNLKNMAQRGEDALDSERARLMRQYEQVRQEVQTYENNLGFLNSSSKKGNSLIDEMNRKVQKLKDDLELTRQKIKAIDQKFKEKDSKEEDNEDVKEEN